MRTWGRVFPKPNETFQPYWVEVQTAENGDDTQVWFTTMIQELLLNLGESPFYANAGIPAYQAVMTQIYPDYYVQLIQQKYSQYFASLTITRVLLNFDDPTPIYQVQAVANTGAVLSATVAY